MLLTELLQLPRLELRIAWGREHLDRQIRRVYTTELLHSGAYLRGGELVLSSTLWWHGPEDSETFVSEMVDGGAVALAAGTAMIGAIPSDLVDACARHDLVLLHVPDHVSFGTITEAVTEHNHAERDAGLDRLFSLRRELANRITEQGLDGALDLAAEELGITTWLTDFAGRPRSGTCPLTSTARLEISDWAMSAPATATHRRVDGESFSLIPVDDRPSWVQSRAYLACAGDLRRWPAQSRAVIDELRHYAAVEIAREEADRGPRRAFLARVAAELLRPEPSLTTVEALMTAAELSPDQAHRVIAASTDDPRNGPAMPLALLTSAADLLAITPTVIEFTGDAFAIVSDRHGAPTSQQWRVQIQAAAQRITRGPIQLRVGIGGTHPGADGLCNSWSEANHALSIARGSGNQTVGIGAIEDVDTIDVVLTSVPGHIQDVFRRTVLGPICDYDATHGSHLLKTLEAALTSDCGTTELAARQHLHPNTLRYRLRRVEELTGRDLAHWQDRLEVLVALRIHVSSRHGGEDLLS